MPSLVGGDDHISLLDGEGMQESQGEWRTPDGPHYFACHPKGLPKWTRGEAA